MAHLRVGPAGYTHYWTKAGAHTAFPAGYEGVVKRAVLEAAIAAGKGEDMDAPVIAHSLAELGGILPEEDKPRRRVKIQDDASDSA